MRANRYPLVSIVASNFNFEKYIPYFIESVLSQTYQNWELIITDDCSNDDSLATLKSYEKRDRRIKVIQNDANRHTYYTLNSSLANAKGEYVCLISCDDALLPEKISHDVQFMEQNDDVGILYGQLIVIDECDVRRGDYGYVPVQKFDRYTLLREMYLVGNRCLAPGMFLRKCVVQAVGPFLPLRVTHDYDYHIRVLFNAEAAFNSVPLTCYRRMSDNSNLSSDNTSHTLNSERNESFLS